MKVVADTATTKTFQRVSTSNSKQLIVRSHAPLGGMEGQRSQASPAPIPLRQADHQGRRSTSIKARSYAEILQIVKEGRTIETTVLKKSCLRPCQRLQSAGQTNRRRWISVPVRRIADARRPEPRSHNRSPDALTSTPYSEAAPEAEREE